MGENTSKVIVKKMVELINNLVAEQKEEDVKEPYSENIESLEDIKVEECIVKGQHWNFEIHNPNYYVYDALHNVLDATNALKFIYQHIKMGDDAIIVGYVGFRSNILKSSIIKKFEIFNVDIFKCHDPITRIEECQYPKNRMMRPRRKNIKFKEPIYIEFKSWQTNILKMLDANHANKKINWYHGNFDIREKMQLVKYLTKQFNTLYMTDPVPICKGLIVDYFNRTKKNDRDNVFIFDFTISDESLDDFPYEQLNEIQYGAFINPSIRSELIDYRPPDIIVFGNVPPDSDYNITKI